ncbi:bifunctional polynucleotide phosphatase/kinase [Nannizzia gypsea CBS 118893]|uniref:Bifunctional polynucleotide phosphatase/kinase n=1 Tax=Arthroderma gypseum (strain ATCC MYA-4604 / CBS 118893) TaxID=535722 RepID=E5R2M5_ARTGP|nr:bifunctional polynucleotide phosphatase/kinase [Nannizzia gypsea CBS 118893]EFQ98683.1 bifunctional polynucleotide phosphatase/kinase [Nannizzia gypsea CBS 118893]
MTSPGSKRPMSSTERAISPPTKKKPKVAASVTSQTVVNFFKPTSQKPIPSQSKRKISWHIANNSCIVGQYLVGQKDEAQKEEQKDGNKTRIAAFDFDHTLIMPKSNSKFSRSASDWKWWDPSVPSKLKQLAADGYTLVIVSNQKAVNLKPDAKAKTGNSDSKSLSVLKEKVTMVLDTLDLDIPVSIYAATQYDEYRKPRMGMWREMVKDLGLDIPDDVEGKKSSRLGRTLDLGNSIFVGDAAGRKGDHSCCDRHFAANVGIPFKTPEEFFRDEPPVPVGVDVFDPKKHMDMDTPSTDVVDKISPPFTKQSDTELVLLCGSPGSGKSTFYWKYLQPLGYERVNQDILKTRQKCLKVANENLLAGKSVAVDNTNANKTTRAEWISLAKTLNLPIRCIYLTTPIPVCKHNNAVRAANPNQESLNPESRTILPPVAFSDYVRRFEEPDVSEGFKDMINVGFQFDGDKEARELWGQHWV